MKLWNFLKTKMMSFPDQYVCEGDTKISFEELVVWAENFSEKLKGVHCCALWCQSELAAAMALLACFAAEVTAMPLSVRYGDLHANKILSKISPDAIMIDEGDELKVLKIPDSQYDPPEETPALLMCTSGTTGSPKGVMLSMKNVITNISDITEYFEIGKKDRIFISRPLYHCAVLTGEFLSALVTGCQICFYSGSYNPQDILMQFVKHRSTVFCTTPTLCATMIPFLTDQNIASLKVLGISGECMGKEIGERIFKAFSKCKIYHLYGLTEACPRVAYLPPELFQDFSDCVGIPLNSVSIKILNDKGRECAVNEDGLLWIRGDNIMLGYYKEVERTVAVFQDGWLCTGDIATMNERGLLKIKGRNDDMIIKAGMNIYPSEIESTLKKDKRVKAVVAYGYNTRFGTQIGIKVAGDFSSVNEIKKLCRTYLPPFQNPSKIELKDDLPKSVSGKLIREVNNA